MEVCQGLFDWTPCSLMWGRCDGAIFSLTVCDSFGYSLVVLLIGCFAHFGRQKLIEMQCAARPPCFLDLCQPQKFD